MTAHRFPQADIRIVRGAPDDDEIAALVVALSTLSDRHRAVTVLRPRASWTRGARYRPPGAWSLAAA